MYRLILVNMFYEIAQTYSSLVRPGLVARQALGRCFNNADVDPLATDEKHIRLSYMQCYLCEIYVQLPRF